MATSVSDIRVAPVGEDLRTDDNRCNVIRGLEDMFRMDKPLGTGVVFDSGEWGVLGDDGKLARATGTALANSYLVFSGTDRFDAKATGQATIIARTSPLIVKTTQFDPGPTYAVGDGLVVKAWASGKSSLTKVTSTEPVVARVHAVVASGVLTFETV